MSKYEIGDVWWVRYPFEEIEKEKHRPAIVIDDETIAILSMYITTQNRNIPYSVQIKNCDHAGLPKDSWARIDKVVSIDKSRFDRKAGSLDVPDLLMVMQLYAEITKNISHDFCLLAVQNSEGKFLQIYDSDWKSWLFPYFRSTDNNKASMDANVQELFGPNSSARYIAKEIHCKYSERDNVYKIYNHKLYKPLNAQIHDFMNCEEFEYKGTKYKWLSLEELESDANVLKKNSEVINFVKNNIN